MRVRRTRELAAPRDRVWEIVSDPWQLPRWWPRTTRVEGVTEDAWSTVLASPRGRAVRADWHVDLNEPSQRRRWVQDLAGTAFERLFDHHHVQVSLEDRGERTAVTLEIEQGTRGWARLAPFLVKRAAREQAEEALDGLVNIAEAR